MKTSSKGFTLIELVVTIAVAAVLLSLAVPGMRNMIRSTAVANQTNAFLNLLTMARSEAIKRSRSVVLCRNTNASSPACATTGSWDQGILMYADTDADGAYDSGEEIRVEVPFTKSGGITAVVTAQTTDVYSVRYGPSGAAVLNNDSTITAGATFTIKAGASDSYCSRSIVVTATGQVRTGSVATGCGS